MFLSKYIGDRKFYLKVMAIAVPLMFQQVISAGVNLVGNLMVGRLVIEKAEKGVGLAAVVVVSKLNNIATFALFGTMAACTIYIAQYYGAKDKEHLKQAYRFGILASLMTGIIFFLLASLFPNNLLRFFTDDVQVIEQGVIYLRYMAIALVPYAITVSISDAMRAIGDVKRPLIASISGMLLSCFLNYVLIFGNLGFPRLEVAGASIGIMISRFVELAILLIFLATKKYEFNTRVCELFKVEKSLIKNILIKGAPLVTNEFFWAFGITMLLRFYSTRGTEVMVGYAISQAVADVFFVLFSGMAAATTVIISQNLGANNLEEAKEDAYRLLAFSIFLAFCMGLGMYLTSFVVPQWFEVTEEARALAKNFIVIVAAMQWIYMCSAQCYFILRAGGDTVATLLMDSCYMWTVNILVVGVLTYYTDFDIIKLYLAGQATDLVKMIIAFYLVKRGKWIVNLTKKKELSYEN